MLLDTSRPLAVLPDVLSILMPCDAAGPPPNASTLADLADAVRQERAAMGRAFYRQVAGSWVQFVGGTAVLPMAGVIVQRPSVYTAYGFATSTEQFLAAHRSLLADEGVRSIVWDIDSPGGSVAGVPEAAGELLAMRGSGKRVVAFSNTVMASAAYWLGSAAEEVVAAPSSITGSIGVVMVHADQSRANDRAGVGISYVHASRYKVEGNPDTPLSADARGAMQQAVDDYYHQFAGAVAKARGTTAAAVRGGYGEGRAVTAGRARAAKLVDRVAAFDDLLGRLGAYTGAGRASASLAGFERRQRLAEAAAG